LWGFELCLGGAKPTNGPSWRRDGADCGQNLNELQIVLFFPTSFSEWVQLMLLL